MRGFSTKAVHGPHTDKDPHGSLRPPLYDSVAFEFSFSRDLELAFGGKKPAHTYSRITNPTVSELEMRIGHLNGAFGVVAVSSGMAAITNTIMALGRSGSNIVTTRHLFGHTLSLFTQTLERWGLETRFGNMSDLSSIGRLIDENTACVFLEIISNPQLEVTDIAEVVGLASTRNVPVVLDGTLTSCSLFDSRKAGVAVEVISSTKFISGGATTTGGLIIDNGTFDWKKTATLRKLSGQFGPGAFIMSLRKDVYRNTGSCLSAHNAWLQILGLETLPLRTARSSSNAFEIAAFLQKRQRVLSVNYPGLPSSAWYHNAVRQFSGGFGGILTFELDGKEECFRFMDSLEIIRKATNLNDNKTLVIHPASTIFSDFTEKERTEMGISERLVRLSVGIEDVEDLKADIKGGLKLL